MRILFLSSNKKHVVHCLYEENVQPKRRDVTFETKPLNRPSFLFQKGWNNRIFSYNSRAYTRDAAPADYIPKRTFWKGMFSLFHAKTVNSLGKDDYLVFEEEEADY